MRGSLNYAIEHLAGSLKLIVVLGHSGCGAVTAAVDVFLEPVALPVARIEALDSLAGGPTAGSRAGIGQED